MTKKRDEEDPRSLNQIMQTKKPVSEAHAKAIETNPGAINLNPMDSEKARQNQLKSAAARSANVKRRKMLKEYMQAMKEMEDDLLTDTQVSALGLMKIQMVEYMNEGSIDEAMELAKVIAEYEQPKLARVDNKTEIKDFSSMSDAELEEYLKNEGGSS